MSPARRARRPFVDLLSPGTPQTLSSTPIFLYKLSPTIADSAVLLTLAPGAYTAQVSGVNNAAGVAIIEVYALP